MVATNQIKNLEHHIFFLGDQLSSLPFEPFKIMEKTSKSSAPVLSAEKPKVSPGFFAFLANCFGFL